MRFVTELTNEYDLLIATDIFEHAPDPIGLVAETALPLRHGGIYLNANCFKPVIKCHLPQLFHWNIGWDAGMKAMGLIPQEEVGYGRAYERVADEFDISAARSVGECSKIVFTLVRSLPRGQGRIGKLLMRALCR